MRKIGQYSGGNNSPADTGNSSSAGQKATASAAAAAVAAAAAAESSASWSEEDQEQMKSCLRSQGRNWQAVADKMGGGRTPEQCKKFFYANRKKLNLDKIVLEYKRANQVGDQPPTLSTDEESGSSTSSCEDEAGGGPSSSAVNHNATGASGSSSPVTKGVDSKPPVPVKIEQPPIKTEIKVEESSSAPGPSSAAAAATAATAHPHQQLHPPPGAPGRPGGIPGKEEDYDSSATVRIPILSPLNRTCSYSPRIFSDECRRERVCRWEQSSSPWRRRRRLPRRPPRRIPRPSWRPRQTAHGPQGPTPGGSSSASPPLSTHLPGPRPAPVSRLCSGSPPAGSAVLLRRYACAPGGKRAKGDHHRQGAHDQRH